MNYNSNNGRPTRPQNGRTPVNAAQGKEISVLSAILTGRRSRSIACVIVALVIALSAVATVTASIVASHRAEDGASSRQSLKADDEKEKDDETDAPETADAGDETDAVPGKTPASDDKTAKSAASDTEKPADGDKKDAAKDGGDAKTDAKDDAEPAETKEEDDPSVHTVTIKFATRDDMVVTTRAETLRDFFRFNNTGLSSAQLANVDLDTRIDSDITISVDRVTYDTITEDESIPYETEYRDSTELDPGATWVYQDGQYGVRTTSYDVKYLNGSEVYREEKNSWVSAEPVTKIVYVGVESDEPEPAATEPADTEPAATEPTPSTSTGAAKNGLPALTVYEDGYITGADGVTRHYYGYIDVKATCFTAGGNTAYGLPADEHVIGVGRYDGTLTPIIPFGTKCYVVGAYGDFGERIAADYGEMFGYKIDICLFPSNPYYHNFGWRDMRVYLID